MNPPSLSSKRIVKRIAPLQLGKILGILYGAMGLLALPFFFVGMLVASHLPTPQRGIFAFIGVGTAFALPVFFRARHPSLVTCHTVSPISQWFGGVEVEVE